MVFIKPIVIFKKDDKIVRLKQMALANSGGKMEVKMEVKDELRFFLALLIGPIIAIIGETFNVFPDGWGIYIAWFVQALAILLIPDIWELGPPYLEPVVLPILILIPAKLGIDYISPIIGDLAASIMVVLLVHLMFWVSVFIENRYYMVEFGTYRRNLLKAKRRNGLKVGKSSYLKRYGSKRYARTRRFSRY